MAGKWGKCRWELKKSEPEAREFGTAAELRNRRFAWM